MKPDFGELEGKVAQAQVVLSLLALLTLYVDPSIGGLFHLGNWLLAVLLCHLLYRTLTYLALVYRVGADPVRKITIGLDLIFATVIAFLTEGRTSPSFIFFAFAIVAVGFRTGFRDTLLITLCCVTLYALVVEISDKMLTVFLMRPVYLAIAGYLIGFFGQQRAHFEQQLHQLETQAQRESIARSLHDGYLHAVAAVNLRLESYRDMLISNELEPALAEIKEIQLGVTGEYDEVRGYVPTSLRQTSRRAVSTTLIWTPGSTFRQNLALQGKLSSISCRLSEGVRNTRRHGSARSGSINVQQATETINLNIDDDGIGFEDSVTPPWTIASRVAKLGGRLVLNSASVGSHLDISLPTPEV